MLFRSQAEIVLWVIDATQAVEQIEQLSHQIIPIVEHKPLLLLINKSDLLSKNELESIQDKLNSIPFKNAQFLLIAAKEGAGINELEQQLVKSAQLPQIAQNDVIVTNARHYEALKLALVCPFCNTKYTYNKEELSKLWDKS